MAASGSSNLGNNDSQEIQLKRLTNFLNQCISPVASESLKPGDTRRFIDAVGLDNDVIKILEHINPDVIIRLFFPNAQLPQAHVSFLKDSIIVFRSRTDSGLYTYQHSLGLRQRYEIKMGFLGLFLLLNYNVTLRIFSVAEENRIGQWEQLGPRFLDHYIDGNLVPPDYDLHIIPPQGMDFSLLLELLPDIKDLAQAFNISSVLQQDFKPLLKNADQMLNLQEALQSKLNTLETDVRETISQVYAQLTPVSRSPEVSESSVIENDEDEKKQPENPAPVVATLEEKILNTFPDNFTSIIPDMFTIKNSLVTMKSPVVIERFPVKYKIINTFYNIFFYTSLFALSKKYDSKLAAAAQDIPFKNLPDSVPSNLLEIWLCRILSAASMIETDEIVETHMQRIFSMVEHFQTSEWYFMEEKNCSIPVEMYSQILTDKYMSDIVNAMVQYKQFVKRIEEINELENMSTLDLFQKLSNPSATRRHPVNWFIRKLSGLTEDKLLDEFGIQRPGMNRDHDPNLRVRPATMIIPLTPAIKTYGGAWQNCSGIFMMTGDSVAFAGYKTPAYSHSLTGNKAQIFGFPYHTESVLRPQGGKPSFSAPEMMVRLYIMRLRLAWEFPDLSRKAFFELYFREYMLQHPTQATVLDIEPLRAYILEILDTRVTRVKDFVKNDIIKYYMTLFDDLAEEAVKYKKLITTVLENRKFYSYHTKMKYIKQNLNYSQSNLNSQQIEFLAAAGKQYKLFSQSKMLVSNEVLLQGVRIINKNEAQPLIVKSYMHLFSTEEAIQIVLQKRHGNIQAIYANVTLIDGQPNLNGILDAIRIQKFVTDNFNQILPFAIYDEVNATMKFFSLETFMNEYGNTAINLSEENTNQDIVAAAPVSVSSSSTQVSVPSVSNAVSAPNTRMTVNFPDSMFKQGKLSEWSKNLKILQEQINTFPERSFIQKLIALQSPINMDDIITMNFDLYIVIVSSIVRKNNVSTQLHCDINGIRIANDNSTKIGKYYVPSWQLVDTQGSLQDTFKILLINKVRNKSNIIPNEYSLECHVVFNEIKINNHWMRLTKVLNPLAIDSTQKIVGVSLTLPQVLHILAAPQASSQRNGLASPLTVLGKRPHNVSTTTSSFSSSSSSVIPIFSSSLSSSSSTLPSLASLPSSTSPTPTIKRSKTSSPTPAATQVSQMGIFSPPVTPPPASNSNGGNIPNPNNTSTSTRR